MVARSRVCNRRGSASLARRNLRTSRKRFQVRRVHDLVANSAHANAADRDQTANCRGDLSRGDVETKAARSLSAFVRAYWPARIHKYSTQMRVPHSLRT